MQKEYIASEQMSFKDKSSLGEEKHGLRGVIQIYRKNKETHLSNVKLLKL